MTTPIQISQLNPISQFAGHIPEGGTRLPVTDSAAGLQVNITLQQTYLSLKLAGEQGRLYISDAQNNLPPDLTGTRFIGKDSPSSGLLSQLFPAKHTVTLTTTAQAQLAARLARQVSAQALPAVTMQVSGLTGHILSLSTLTPTAALRLPVPDTVLASLNRPGQPLPSSALLKITDSGQSVQVTLDKAHPGTTFNIPLPTQGDRQAVKQAMLLQQLATGGMHVATQTTDIQQAIKPALPAGLMNQVSQHHAALIELNGKYLTVHTLQAQPLARLTFTPEVAARLPHIPGPDSAQRPLVKLRLSATIPTASVTSGSQKSPDTITLPGRSKEFLPEPLETMSPRQADATRLSGLNTQIVQDKIQSLARQLLADTGSTNKALVSLLSSLHQLSGSQHHEQTAGQARELGNRLLASLASPSGKEHTVDTAQSGSADQLPDTADPAISIEKLKSLMTGPALLLTPQVITAPAPVNSFVGALVTLLQITLAGRALTRHPELAKTSELVAEDTSKATESRFTARAAKDFAALDTQQDMVKQIKTLLANQQTARLGNTEARLQGQDQLYFVLPVASHRQAPTELLIRREAQQQEREAKTDCTNRNWNLTMKLDVGKSGQILAKTKISGTSVNVNLYTSTDTLLNIIRDTLPYLLRRLNAHGLDVAGSSVQRGQIPASLAQHNYHLFETLV